MLARIRLSMIAALASLAGCAAQTAPAAPPEKAGAPEPTSGAEQRGEVVDVPAVGFRLRAPDGWTLIDSAWAHEQTRDVDFGSKEFNEKVRARATEPIVVLVKDKDTVSATVKVALRPQAGKGDPVALAKATTAQMSKQLSWFELNGEIESLTVSDLPAATFAFNMTMALDDGKEVELESRSYIVPRAGGVFIIGASRPLADEDAAEELKAVVDSIEIAH